MSDPTETIAKALHDLCGLGDAVEEGDQREQALRLKLLRELMEEADAMVAKLELLLAENMEDNYIRYDGVGWVIRKPKKPSTAGSDWEGARRAAVNEIARRVSLDRATGEQRLDWKHVAEDALGLWERSMTAASPTSGFHKVLGLDTSEFIRRSPAGFYVTILENLP